MFNKKLIEENERLRWKIESLEDQLRDLKKALDDSLRITRSHLLAVKHGEDISDQAIVEGRAFDMINGEQFAALQRKADDLIVVDVRTLGEVNNGFISGAVHIPIDQFSFRFRELGENRKRPILVYCASGVRSEVACETLTKNGYERVYNLQGGIGSFVGTLEVPSRSKAAAHVETDNPDLFNQVQNLLNAEINPAVANHGGNVTLVAVHHEKAYIRFGGGCQGCGMADVTLRQGIVKRIQETIPAIAEVVDLTDHASGSNPYFTGASAH